MTKEKMLNTIDKLIEIKEKSIKEFNKAILDMQDSPGVTNHIAYIPSDDTRALSQLNELKLKIENYDKEKLEVGRLFNGYPEAIAQGYFDAIVFTDEEKEGE